MKKHAVHFITQGKGGVGKSLSASFLAQYLLNLGRNVICADTDPVNATFTQYKSLQVEHIAIAENGAVLQRKFDPLMEAIATSDAEFVIDNGAATFLPLTRYMAENDIYRIMAESGKDVFVHCIVTGGQAKSDTFNGLMELIDKVNSHAKIVIWQNEFWGKVEFGEGKPITATRQYKDAAAAGKIAGIVRLANWSDSDTFAGDIKQMTEAHLTVNEVLASDAFGFLAKNRLQKVLNSVYTELDAVEWA